MVLGLELKTFLPTCHGTNKRGTSLLINLYFLSFGIVNSQQALIELMTDLPFGRCKANPKAKTMVKVTVRKDGTRSVCLSQLAFVCMHLLGFDKQCFGHIWPHNLCM